MRRIADLDAALSDRSVSGDQEAPGNHLAIWSLVTHFANVMSEYTATAMYADARKCDVADTEALDSMTAASVLLDCITKYEPSLTIGPLLAERQHWTRTGRHIRSDGTPLPPSKGHFVPPLANIKKEASVKPFYMGLYTSTATSAGYSTWRALLGPYGSMLYPTPWYTWELEVKKDIRIAEIVSAKEWVEFVSAYCRMTRGFIYPNWVAIAREFDAVHMTLSMIVATQGFWFRAPRGVIPPAFWDIETTFWLNWCFTGARLVEVIDDHATGRPHG